MEKDDILIYSLAALSGACIVVLFIVLICFCTRRCEFVSNKEKSGKNDCEEGTSKRSHEVDAETSRPQFEVRTGKQKTEGAVNLSYEEEADTFRPKVESTLSQNRYTEGTVNRSYEVESETSRSKHEERKNKHKTKDAVKRFEKREAELMRKMLSLEEELSKEKQGKAADLERFKKEEDKFIGEKSRLKDELRNEKIEKENALKRLSAIMSSRIKDGNPNVVDLTDQNRPTKVGEQFSELYDNQWTDAYGAIDNFIGSTIPESEIVGILLEILKQCFTECKARSKRQMLQLNENVTEIATRVSKMPSVLSDDLMQRIKEERKLFSPDDVPDLDEILPILKENFSSKVLDTNFLEEQVLKLFVQECLKISWLMVIKDPPMTMVLNPQPDTYGNFKAYKTRGKVMNYVVWPALLLEEGGPLVLKGVAEFIDQKEINKSCENAETCSSDQRELNHISC